MDNITIVGVGASAGGLEALQDFFKSMPLDTGIAFVVIQHLSPDYKSLMDELLARQTKIPIIVAQDAMEIKPNTVFLIPPRNNISVYHGKLYLEDQGLRKGLNLPVDIFFRSLAIEKGSEAIGVILSGTGSDGTLGVKAIKEAGGMIIVQDPDSAKFDGMPRSSISTGLVDYTIPPDKMPETLVQFLKHPFVTKTKVKNEVLNNATDAYTRILMLLRDSNGTDFSYYKEKTILRRLERRLSINRLDSIEEYIKLLSASEKEKSTLNRELLIGVTRFFRDPEAFESLKERIIPLLLKKKTIRIWSAGCSTGEEVYSLAILFKEYVENNGLQTEVKIFATDIDSNSIEIASKGFYLESLMADIDPIYLYKYFTRTESGYTVKDDIRKMIVFARHNILKDSPFSKLDLVVCRNLFIYIKPKIQTKIISMFYYSLNPEGFLFMGSSETLGEMGDAFDVIDIKWKIYRYKTGYKLPLSRELPLFASSSKDTENFNILGSRSGNNQKIEKIFNEIMINFLPPSILIDNSHNIYHIIGDLSPFVKLPTGRFSSNIYNNLQPELVIFVSSVIRRLNQEKESLILEKITGITGYQDKRVSIQGKMIEIDRSIFFLISFIQEDFNNIPIKIIKNTENFKAEFSSQVEELERELQYTKESLQATVEELETSNEELQSSNEELIASNEELQSTNEELQSVNEELYTVNSEYQIKIDELTRLNDDINNLLNNTEVGALYLDRNLCIRKITPMVSKVTNIIQSDIGRPISHISLNDLYETILDDINSVVNTLQPIDREIKLENNSIFYLKIRPYRTDYNSIDGILLTFVDISKLVKESQRADLAMQRLNSALEVGNMAWWQIDQYGNFNYDHRLPKMLGYTDFTFPKNFQDFLSLLHIGDYKKFQTSINNLNTNETSIGITCRFKKIDTNFIHLYCNAKNITENNKNVINGIFFDVTSIIELENEVQISRDYYRNLIENSPIAQTVVNAIGEIIYANPIAEELLGLHKNEIEELSYDSPKWKATGINGKELTSEDLPFSIIKRTEKPLRNFRHYIHDNKKNIKKLLNIDGAPIFLENGTFDGCTFVLGQIYE